MRKTKSQKHGCETKGLNEEGYRITDFQDNMKEDSTEFVNKRCDRNICLHRGWRPPGISWKLVRNAESQTPRET